MHQIDKEYYWPRVVIATILFTTVFYFGLVGCSMLLSGTPEAKPLIWNPLGLPYFPSIILYLVLVFLPIPLGIYHFWKLMFYREEFGENYHTGLIRLTSLLPLLRQMHWAQQQEPKLERSYLISVGTVLYFVVVNLYHYWKISGIAF